MVPLVMSTPREDNPNCTFEEFATHLSLYDDSFHFVEKSSPSSSASSSLSLSVLDDSKLGVGNRSRANQGPLPPSVFCPNSKKADEVAGQVKVKRKCGRPRNPIPRHKRESHINAEHKRRGKIQDGFRTLKNIVPKYEQGSGRDSKADILFKAVDHCRLLQNDIQKLSSSVETLKAERDVLSSDIKNYKTLVPDVSVYEDEMSSSSMDSLYAEYVRLKTKENWAFGTFKVIMRPLFESYKLSVRRESMSEFLRSVADWASSSLNASNLKTVFLAMMKDVPMGYGSAGSYKDGLMSDILNSPGSVCHSLVSDKNNNSFSFTPEHHLDSRGGALGVGTAEPYGNGFDAYTPTNNGSPIAKAGPHMIRKYPPQDLVVPLRGGTTCSSVTSGGIFSDLYYSTDHDLHRSNHLNFGKTLDGCDHWSQLQLQQQNQQHHRYYQNNHISPASHYHDLKKVHPFWGSQYPAQQLTGDFSFMAPHCYPHPLLNREFTYNLPRSKEKSEMHHSPPCQISHPLNFLSQEHSRHKDLSQSSIDSECSPFGMDLLAKQATEALGDHNLSPSTNSCASPDSSSIVPSPEVLSARISDFSFSYNRSIPPDDFKQHKPAISEITEKQVDQVPFSLSSFREAPCSNANIHKYSMTKSNEEVGNWTFNTSKSPPAINPRYHPTSESSSILAAILSKQMLLTAKQVHHTADIGSPPPHDNSYSKLAPSNFQLKSSHKDADNYINGLPVSVKPEGSYKLSSFVLDPVKHAFPAARKLPSSPSKESHDDQHSNFQSNTSQAKCFMDQTASDFKHLYGSSSDQTQQYHKDFDVVINETTQAQTQRQHNQICYFEMAHQELLKSQSLSTNFSDKVREFKPTNFTRSPPLGSHPPDSGSELISSNLNPSSADPNPVFPSVTSVSYSGNSNYYRALTHQMSPITASNQKAGRKNSFEESFPEDQLLEAARGCKKSCIWQLHDEDKQSLIASGKSNNCDTMRESDCIGEI